jgi:hypothetical protein
MMTTRPEVEPAGLYTQKQADEAPRVERHTTGNKRGVRTN